MSIPIQKSWEKLSAAIDDKCGEGGELGSDEGEPKDPGRDECTENEGEGKRLACIVTSAKSSVKASNFSQVFARIKACKLQGKRLENVEQAQG